MKSINVLVKLPQGAAGCNDPPDAASIKVATDRAANVWCPPPPHPELIWGYFRKPQLLMWCTACKSYVSLVTFNTNTKDCKKADGQCAHYDPSTAKAYLESTIPIKNGWCLTIELNALFMNYKVGYLFPIFANRVVLMDN